MKMKLTKEEQKWLEDVQVLLMNCPSRRMGFYTIGDAMISVYDFTKEKKINDIMDQHSRMDFPEATIKAGADTGKFLMFPNNVHSVSG